MSVCLSPPVKNSVEFTFDVVYRLVEWTDRSALSCNTYQGRHKGVNFFPENDKSSL